MFWFNLGLAEGQGYLSSARAESGNRDCGGQSGITARSVQNHNEPVLDRETSETHTATGLNPHCHHHNNIPLALTFILARIHMC